MKIGNLDITNCKIGSVQVNEVRIGSTLVWSFSSFDPDAQAFITAAAIIDPIQQTAVNNLVVALKGYGIWTKMKALYPFVGGTATTHKYNLKNPLDTDAAFRLVFSGGWTHSSTGALPNGTNAFADIKLIPNTVLAQNSFSFGFYSRTNIDALIVDIGSVGSNGVYTLLFSRYSNTIYNAINSSVTYTTSVNNDSKGLYIGNRTASNIIKNYKNGTLLTTGTTGSTGNNNGSIYLGAFNNNGALQYYSNREYAFAFIADAFSDTEVANYYAAVQTFQTSLLRNI